jgi:SH3 domain-containing YSC84-like protein 1
MRLLQLSGSFLVLAALAGCARDEPPLVPASGNSPQQAIVDRSADALASMRSSGEFPNLDGYLASARGVMIFPRLVKAGLLFGGEGGTGVLLARADDGAWSAPAFYSIGGGSVGLQIGYQEASVVFVLMTEKAVNSAIDRGFTLGSDVTVAAGSIGDAGEARRGTTAKDVYSFAAARGVFAGLSFDGAFVSARTKHNYAYYGPGATPAAILIEHRFERPGAHHLQSLITSATPE